MTEARAHRQFGSTEHLASEAIAAYVDGELRMQAYLRASHHISICAECAAAVDAQQQARGAASKRRDDDAVVPGGTSQPDSFVQQSDCRAEFGKRRQFRR